MAQEVSADRKRPDEQTAATVVPPQELATAPTTFTTAGEIPPVAPTAPASTGLSASERAFATGIDQLRALLASGRPDPKAVVALLDAHRDEHDAMLALLAARLGAAYVAEVRGAMGLRASIARKEVVAGDPANPNGGYFIASQAQQGAKWSTAGGGFTGTIDKNGLDSTVRLDDNDSLHAQVKADKSGTLAWNHDGKTAAELYGNYHDGNNYDAGVRRTWGVGDGQLTTSLDHNVSKDTTTDAAIASYKTGDGKTTASASAGLENGGLFESLNASTKVNDTTTLTGSAKHTAAATTGSLGAAYHKGNTNLQGSIARNAADTSLHFDGSEQLSPAWTLRETLDANVPDSGHTQLTGSLAAAYKHDSTTFDAGVTRAADSTKLHLSGSEVPADHWKLEQSLDSTIPDHGQSQTVLKLGESYRTGNLVESGSLEAGVGHTSYLRANGGLDAQLAPNLYAGAFGSYSYSGGKQDTAQIGASLTFTPQEKQALTLAGVIDQNGTLEARLQYDIFKSRIESVQDLADHKKDALISLFVSYRADSGRHALDDRFGAPQLDTGAGQQIMGGIRIKF
jgi:hypothetical protein